MKSVLSDFDYIFQNFNTNCKIHSDKKVDIQDLSATNKLHIDKMYKTFGTDKIFGRTDTEKVIGLKSAGTSKFLKMLLNKGIIEPVK